jgi:hypothetical protein
MLLGPKIWGCVADQYHLLYRITAAAHSHCVFYRIVSALLGLC